MFRIQWGLWLHFVSCLFCIWHMQSQVTPALKDFKNLDCGKPEGSGNEDLSTNLFYESDAAYISAGEIHNVSDEYRTGYYAEQAKDLRCFPNGARNCYTIPVNSSYSKFLVRAWFLYGNYDGLGRPPKFDLHIGANLWRAVDTSNASYWQYHEVIAQVEQGRNLSVCLVKTNSDVPFISALEVRPLDGNMYGLVSETRSLMLFTRLDVKGGETPQNEQIRYQSDPFDRIWTSQTAPDRWDLLQTGENISQSANYVPQGVLRTAAVPKEGEQLSFCWGASQEPSNEFFAYIYMVELRAPLSKGTGNFSVQFQSNRDASVSLTHDVQTTVSWAEPTVKLYDKIEIEFKGVNGSKPLVNALEVFMTMNVTERETDKQDVGAINAVKIALNVRKDDWAGDPCAPKNFSWSGITCRYAGNNPRITALNLSSSGLTGIIPDSLKNLDNLESLDLSNNRLGGKIPDFMANLPLKFLDLSSNNFEGTIPKSLNEKPFTFRFGNNPDLCRTADWRSCKRKKIKMTVVIVSCVAAVLVIGLVILFVVRRQKKRIQVQRIKYGFETETNASSQYKMDFHHESRQFSFAELLKITNNFNKVIGKGGFGFVYHGVLESGMEVAVKCLSHSSSQGPREFLKEAQLLSRIHHRNLVSLVGYCDDVQHLALVYEYMSNGSLKDNLSGKTSHAELSSWRDRLRIAKDVCQGLEYLHKGCKPSVIHRDVKTSNILLNQNMEAKLADFGLSRIFHNDSIVDQHSHVSTSIMGTPGYLDPEYSSTNQLTEKSDVYSFGVILLELITGLEAIIRQEQNIHIVQVVVPIIQKGDINNIIDKQLQGQYDINSIWKAVEIAISCTHDQSIDRPNITEVIMQLNDCIEIEDQGKLSLSNFDSSSNYGLGMPSMHDSLIGYPSAR